MRAKRVNVQSITPSSTKSSQLAIKAAFFAEGVLQVRARRLNVCREWGVRDIPVVSVQHRDVGRQVYRQSRLILRELYVVVRVEPRNVHSVRELEWAPPAAMSTPVDGPTDT